MTTTDEQFTVGFLITVVAISIIVAFFTYVESNGKEYREARQQQIDTFYRVHDCKPLGYVASRYDPVRTYQCDNGVFIAEDMK